MKIPARKRHCPECRIDFTEPEHDTSTDNYADTLCPQCLAVGVIVDEEPTKGKRS